MNRDGNANIGDDDETPEEMVNRSLAQAYDNQQRYMEMFQHSAHMLQVLSRFMADPIVVHDLEEEESDTDSTSTQFNSTTPTPIPCGANNSVVSSSTYQLYNGIPDNVVSDIVDASVNLNPSALQGSNSRRRPQSSRVRPQRQTVNRIGWSSDTENHVIVEPGFLRNALQQRAIDNDTESAGDSSARPMISTSPCSPFSNVCNASTTTSIRLDTDLEVVESSMTAAGEGFCPQVAKNMCGGSSHLPIQNNAGGDSKQNVSGGHASLNKQPSSNDTASIAVNTSAQGHSSTESGISETRVHRFQVGISTQTSIKNAMTEISKAAATIRQARDMLSSFNQGCRAQMNNNNHETIDKDRKEDNSTETSSGQKKVLTNVLKFVQPAEPTFGNSAGTSSAAVQSEHPCNSSSKPILVKPVAKNRISLIEKPAKVETSEPERLQLIDECDERSEINLINSEMAISPNHFRSIMRNRNVVRFGICGSRNLYNTNMRANESTNVGESSNPSSLTKKQTSNTKNDLQTGCLEQPSMHVPLKSKFSTNPLDDSVKISVDTFKHALTQAIQTLQKEGVMIHVNENTPGKSSDSKLDKNNFSFPTSWRLNHNKDFRSPSSIGSVVQDETTQLNRSIHDESVTSEGQSECIQYETEHYLVLKKGSIMKQNTGEQSESTQCSFVNFTPVTPFTESEQAENDKEVKSVTMQDSLWSNQATNQEVSEATNLTTEEDDGLEMIYLNQPTPIKQESNYSYYSSTSSASQRMNSGVWADQGCYENPSTPKTPHITPIKNFVITKSDASSSAFRDNRCGDGGDIISSLVEGSQKVDPKPIEMTSVQENENDERKENNENPTKAKEKVGIFKRFSSTVKGWFKKKS